ncbi:MAG: hypothetical protein KDC31_11690 [Saprospiraceae bacterium]|jgi:mevalonate kinase|nr:hypothetical protein [Saprospiraceae bacterium]MBX7178872.1 hypothetical protein [Saprospiraceae bacterium]MCB0591948.1 hypothetical protein [Saprospiraceae bacterium]MCO5283912.1 GYDIA family GHMP kinase [Saprospiraceae bacterium]MCO6469701.1 hypothetical protein [Saprospiraceae bacterium]
MNISKDEIPGIHYNARGKLMITGEYLALKGARCLAWPTHALHHLEVHTLAGQPGTLIWNASDKDGKPWFDALFSTSERVETISSSDFSAADYLGRMLNAAIALKGKNILEHASFHVETKIEWPMEWGMGSSSSLLVNIASWFGVNPFTLQQKTIGGSGYDIACGLSDEVIVFQNAGKLLANKVHRPEILVQYAGFAYLGKKADTASAITDFSSRTEGMDLTAKIHLIDRLTYHILDAKTVHHAIKAIEIHEEVIGSLLDVEPIKLRLYKDFDGAVKSLGAWGGDFIMFVGSKPLEEFRVSTEEKYGIKLYSAAELLV